MQAQVSRIRRAALTAARRSSNELAARRAPRAALDILFDFAVILLCFVAVNVSLWLLPPAAVLVGNRQRALGNLLHDASHGNLFERRASNGMVGRLILGPVCLTDFANYCRLHMAHHRDLGNGTLDPDVIKTTPAARWWITWWRVCDYPRAVPSAAIGDLGNSKLPIRIRLFMFTWWLVVTTLAVIMFDARVAAICVTLWLVARVGVFHPITSFREMCDHYGLQPGHELDYTRDIPRARAWSLLFHPRNNGYHLTHHLIPAIPYHGLPAAHEWLLKIPEFATSAKVNARYFGAGSVTRSWERTE